jgi:hypothetical protein
MVFEFVDRVTSMIYRRFGGTEMMEYYLHHIEKVCECILFGAQIEESVASREPPYDATLFTRGRVRNPFDQ